MKARVYELCDFCHAWVEPYPEPGHCPHCRKPTTRTYDSADVLPLVEAARNAVKELDYAPPGESERDSSCRIKSKWWLEAALAPFEEEERP